MDKFNVVHRHDDSLDAHVIKRGSYAEVNAWLAKQDNQANYQIVKELKEQIKELTEENDKLHTINGNLRSWVDHFIPPKLGDDGIDKASERMKPLESNQTLETKVSRLERIVESLTKETK